MVKQVPSDWYPTGVNITSRIEDTEAHDVEHHEEEQNRNTNVQQPHGDDGHVNQYSRPYWGMPCLSYAVWVYITEAIGRRDVNFRTVYNWVYRAVQNDGFLFCTKWRFRVIQKGPFCLCAVYISKDAAMAIVLQNFWEKYEARIMGDR